MRSSSRIDSGFCSVGDVCVFSGSCEKFSNVGLCLCRLVYLMWSGFRWGSKLNCLVR